MAGDRVQLAGVQHHAVHGWARSILAVGVLGGSFSMELCADCSGWLLAVEQCLGSCFVSLARSSTSWFHSVSRR